MIFSRLFLIFFVRFVDFNFSDFSAIQDIRVIKKYRSQKLLNPQFKLEEVQLSTKMDNSNGYSSTSPSVDGNSDVNIDELFPFSSLSENFQKVKFVEDLLSGSQYLRNIFKQNPKSNDLSIALRKEGNENFSLKFKNYFRALELYNKSICFSLPDSENIAIGYANRSAVLFQLKKYKQCLENINMAREANIPDRLMDKLNKRENDCKTRLESQKPEIKAYDFTLSFGRHPVVPYISNCLGIDSTKEEGRFIYTKTDLKPGNVVAIEKPYSVSLYSSMRYIRCAYCTGENYFTLIPCTHCTSAMFCSESCRNKAWESFHKYECPVIDSLFECCPETHLGALRTCLKTLSAFDSIDDCRKFCRDPKHESKTVFDLNFGNLTKIEEYKAVHGLVTNQEKQDVDELFQRAALCATIKKLLLEYTPLQMWLGKNIENHNFLADFLFKHSQIAPSNCHGIDSYEQGGRVTIFANGAYPFLSLLNHSCAPNVVRICKGTTIILFVLRNIEANGKLYDNYGYHYTSHAKSFRQSNLLEKYKFNCKCEACENDYHFRLLPRLELPNVITEKDREHLQKFDFRFASENFLRYTAYLEKFGKSIYPCNQLVTTEEYLKKAWLILADAVSMKAKISTS